MRARPFKQVDVFSTEPFRGNPVAVVLDGEGLDTAHMQAMAAWTNLSETAFVLPSQRAEYLLRIFSPTDELPFAGHPTIGSAHAVLETGLATGPSLTQDCGAGLVPLDVADDGTITAEVPVATLHGDAVDAARLTAVLGASALAEPRVIETGPRWLVARMTDTEEMLRLDPDQAALAAFSRATQTVGVTLYVAADGADLKVRTFAPATGAPEDPVCGSGNAAVGVHLHDLYPSEARPAHTARQGAAMGRNGVVQVAVEDGRVRLGGRAVTTIDGTITA